MDTHQADTPRHSTSHTGDHVSLELERLSISVTRATPDRLVLNVSAPGLSASAFLTDSELGALAAMLASAETRSQHG